MDANEILPGKKKDDIPNELEVLFPDAPLPKEVLEDGLTKNPPLPSPNPVPYMKPISGKGKDRKMKPGIEVGLNFSF